MSLEELQKMLDNARREVPTYLDTLPEGTGEQAELEMTKLLQEGQLLLHPRPVNLAVRRDEEAVTPEGTGAFTLFRRDRSGNKIGQILVPEQAMTLDKLRTIQETLKDDRVRLGMVASEEEPGIVGRLFLLVPVDAFPEDIQQRRRERRQEDWQDSVPEPPELGDEWSESGSGPDNLNEDLGWEAGDRQPLGAWLLGSVVRFQEDRVWPDQPLKEAKDLFMYGLTGGLPDISERWLRELGVEPDDPDNEGRTR